MIWFRMESSFCCKPNPAILGRFMGHWPAVAPPAGKKRRLSSEYTRMLVEEPRLGRGPSSFCSRFAGDTSRPFAGHKRTHISARPFIARRALLPSSLHKFQVCQWYRGFILDSILSKYLDQVDNFTTLQFFPCGLHGCQKQVYSLCPLSTETWS